MKESTKEELMAAGIGVAVVIVGAFLFFALNLQSYANQVAAKLSGKASN